MCFRISFFAIVITFLIASISKSSDQSTFEWIKWCWEDGYCWGVIGAVLFAVAGVILLFVKLDQFLKLWNNKTVMIIVSAVLFIILLFVFFNSILMYIVSMAGALGVCSFVSFKMQWLNKENIGKILLASFALGLFIFLLLLGLSGEDCSACGGKGYIGAAENVGPFIDCPYC
jgi:hypothetical protein